MDMNRLINMAVRMLMNKGINKGIDVASRGGKKPQDMTPQERQASRKTRQNTQNARRGLGILRRFMR